MTTIGLYTDSEVLGGAERSLLNLVAAYHGTAKLVVLSTNRHFLREIDHMEGIDSTFPVSYTHLTLPTSDLV